MPIDREPKITISSQSILKGNSNKDSLKRLMGWGIHPLSLTANSLGVKLALEPLNATTKLGQDIKDLLEADDYLRAELYSIDLISQPPRGEKNLGQVRSATGLIYLLTQDYREHNLAQVGAVQSMIERKTGRQVNARMHEPLTGETKRPNHDLVKRQELAIHPEYFNAVILGEENEWQSNEKKVALLAQFMETNGYIGYSANLLRMLDGSMTLDASDFLERLLDTTITVDGDVTPLVSRIEITPERQDLGEVFAFETMLPLVQQAHEMRPEDLKYYYAGPLSHAESDLNQIKKTIRA